MFIVLVALWHFGALIDARVDCNANPESAVTNSVPPAAGSFQRTTGSTAPLTCAEGYVAVPQGVQLEATCADIGSFNFRWVQKSAGACVKPCTSVVRSLLLNTFF